MPFDTFLSIAFIIIVISVLILRTHLGLAMLLMLSSYLIVASYSFVLLNFLSDLSSIFDTLAAGLAVSAFIILLPAYVVVFRLRHTAKGRFFHQIVPSMLFGLLSLSLVVTIVYGIEEFNYVRNSYAANWLVTFQPWIISFSLVAAILDIHTHYKPRAKKVKSRSKKK